MEGLESVYAQATTQESRIMEFHGSDLIWGTENPNLSCCFMSDLELIDEIQKQQDTSLDPSTLDCFLSTNSNNTSMEDNEGISLLFSDSHMSFNGVSSAESQNKEIKTKLNSFKRNREEDKTRTLLSFNVVSSAVSENKEIKTNPNSFKRNREEETRTHQWKKPRFSSSNISFQTSDTLEPDTEAIKQMKEMIYRTAAFRPVNFGVEIVEKPKRKNVKISKDPQTVAARQRREKISEKIRVLQRLVPGGTKMDTASMLDEAANYLKFLRAQVKALENLRPKIDPINLSFSSASSSSSSFPLLNPFLPLQNPNYIHDRL